MHDRDSKLGEYILFAGEFNRCDPFATSADNFATLDESSPSVNAQGEFDLYREDGNPSNDERRVLVRSDHLYGARRRIDRVVFDVPYADSLWTFAATTGVGSPHGLRSIAYLDVLAVTKDFDPATVTWTSATSGDSQLTYSATSVHMEIGYWEGELWGDNDTLSCEARLATLLYVPGPLGAEHAWNVEDAIVGFEIRAALSTGDNSESLRWLGDLETGPLPHCFAIRA